MSAPSYAPRFGPDVCLPPLLDHRLIRCYHCQPMNLYREILPADCPPAAAEEIVSPRIVYRLVDGDPPADADFDSWRGKNPEAQPRTASECQARGLSVFSRSRDVRNLIELSSAKEARICQVTLGRGAGRIQKTGGRSHYTWWPRADFDILARCPVMP